MKGNYRRNHGNRIQVKLVLALVMCCFLAGAVSASFLSGSVQKARQDLVISQGDIVLDFSFEEPRITNKGTITNPSYTIEIDGLLCSNQYLMPQLPEQPFSVLLPYGKMMQEVSVISSSSVHLGNIHGVQTGSLLLPILDNQPVHYVSFDESQPGYSKELFSIQGVYSLQGMTIVNGYLNPVLYDEVTGDVSFYRHMTLVITTKDDANANQAFRGVPEGIECYEFENPEALQTYVTQDVPSPRETHPYVLITSQALKNATGEYTFQDLLAYREYQGLNPRVVTVEEIVRNPQYWVNGTWGDNNPHNPFYRTRITKNYYRFNDTQAKIRNFIRDAYKNWGTRYVLLGGDADMIGEGQNIVPVRYLFAWEDGLPLSGDRLENYQEDDIPCDLYYACLDGNFNKDMDAHFGEGSARFSITAKPVEEADLYAEVWVGRACVDNSTEVSNFVMKTLAYADQPFDEPYLQQMLFIGESLGANFDPPEGGAYKDAILPSLPSFFNVSTLYDRNGAWSGSMLIDRMNNETYQLFNHMGHAYLISSMKISNDAVPLLTNEKYFFAYSQGCLSGSFDNFNSFNISGLQGQWFGDGSYYTEDSSAEHFTVETPYGAFAGVWNARFGIGGSDGLYNAPSQQYDEAFFKALFVKNMREIGRANHYSKEANAGRINENGFRWSYYCTNLFGDPAQAILPLFLKNNTCVESINAPRYIAPAGTIMVNASIANSGETNATNLLVRFCVDDREIDSKVLPFLERKTRTFVDFEWPVVLGDHCFTINISSPGFPEDLRWDNERSTPVTVGVFNTRTKECFTTIQEAINAINTTDGDTLQVPCGVYHEQVDITKNIVLLGLDQEQTILRGFSRDSAVIHILNQNSVTVTGLTIENDETGILVESSSHTTLCNISMVTVDIGLSLASASNTTIHTVDITADVTGVSVDSSTATHIIDAVISGGAQAGVALFSSSDTTISNTDISGSEIGIMVDSSSVVTLMESMMTQNSGAGVLLDSSDRIIIFSTELCNNFWGIRLVESSLVTISNNSIHDNYEGFSGGGIQCTQTSDTLVSNNTILKNSIGISCDAESSRNLIYHNAFNNTVNAQDLGEENQWDYGYYGADGVHPVGGNYWSDYTGVDDCRGPDQNLPFGGEGIGDTPYLLSAQVCDRYPLMEPWVGLLPGMIYVDDDTQGTGNGTLENPFLCIQDGIDLCRVDDDVVFVFNGTYPEQVEITRSHLRLIGEAAEGTIIDGQGSDVVSLSAESVTVRGFTIQNGSTGVYLDYNTRQSTIAGNIIQNNDLYGIYFYGAYHNTLNENFISGNGRDGIYVVASSYNTVVDNTVQENGRNGIRVKYYADPSNNNCVYHNNFIENTGGDGYEDSSCSNVYDMGYPSGGNYWSDFEDVVGERFDDYQGVYQNEWGSDGIIDLGAVMGGGLNPYFIGSSVDTYSFMVPDRWVVFP
jgi:parallel beta-helix repeat protein